MAVAGVGSPLGVTGQPLGGLIPPCPRSTTAHAGIGSFLLDAGLDAGRDDWVALAAETGRYLVATAVRDTSAAALWPAAADGGAADGDKGGNPMEHWCSGSAGVGLFLLRHWAVSGDPASGLRPRTDRIPWERRGIDGEHTQPSTPATARKTAADGADMAASCNATCPLFTSDSVPSLCCAG